MSVEMNWVDRFVKIRGRHWLVAAVCPLGVTLTCYYNGERKNFRITEVEEVKGWPIGKLSV
jgi:hypothetical protein